MSSIKQLTILSLIYKSQNCLVQPCLYKLIRGRLWWVNCMPFNCKPWWVRFSKHFPWVLLNLVTDACSVEKSHVVSHFLKTWPIKLVLLKRHLSSYLSWSSKLQRKQTSFNYNFSPHYKVTRKAVLSNLLFPIRLSIVFKPLREQQFKEQLIAKLKFKYCFDLSKILMLIFNKLWCMQTCRNLDIKGARSQNFRQFQRWSNSHRTD